MFGILVLESECPFHFTTIYNIKYKTKNNKIFYKIQQNSQTYTTHTSNTTQYKEITFQFYLFKCPPHHHHRRQLSSSSLNCVCMCALLIQEELGKNSWNSFECILWFFIQFVFIIQLCYAVTSVCNGQIQRWKKIDAISNKNP